MPRGSVPTPARRKSERSRRTTQHPDHVYGRQTTQTAENTSAAQMEETPDVVASASQVEETQAVVASASQVEETPDAVANQMTIEMNIGLDEIAAEGDDAMEVVETEGDGAAEGDMTGGDASSNGVSAPDATAKGAGDGDKPGGESDAMTGGDASSNGVSAPDATAKGAGDGDMPGGESDAMTVDSSTNGASAPDASAAKKGAEEKSGGDNGGLCTGYRAIITRVPKSWLCEGSTQTDYVRWHDDMPGMSSKSTQVDLALVCQRQKQKAGEAQVTMESLAAESLAAAEDGAQVPQKSLEEMRKEIWKDVRNIKKATKESRLRVEDYLKAEAMKIVEDFSKYTSVENLPRMHTVSTEDMLTSEVKIIPRKDQYGEKTMERCTKPVESLRCLSQLRSDVRQSGLLLKEKKNAVHRVVAFRISMAQLHAEKDGKRISDKAEALSQMLAASGIADIDSIVQRSNVSKEQFVKKTLEPAIKGWIIDQGNSDRADEMQSTTLWLVLLLPRAYRKETKGEVKWTMNGAKAAFVRLLDPTFGCGILTNCELDPLDMLCLNDTFVEEKLLEWLPRFSRMFTEVHLESNLWYLLRLGGLDDDEELRENEKIVQELLKQQEGKAPDGDAQEAGAEVGAEAGAGDGGDEEGNGEEEGSSSTPKPRRAKRAKKQVRLSEYVDFNATHSEHGKIPPYPSPEVTVPGLPDDMVDLTPLTDKVEEMKHVNAIINFINTGFKQLPTAPGAIVDQDNKTIGKINVSTLQKLLLYAFSDDMTLQLINQWPADDQDWINAGCGVNSKFGRYKGDVVVYTLIKIIKPPDNPTGVIFAFALNETVMQLWMLAQTIGQSTPAGVFLKQLFSSILSTNRVFFGEQDQLGFRPEDFQSLGILFVRADEGGESFDFNTPTLKAQPPVEEAGEAGAEGGANAPPKAKPNAQLSEAMKLITDLEKKMMSIPPPEQPKKVFDKRVIVTVKQALDKLLRVKCIHDPVVFVDKFGRFDENMNVVVNTNTEYGKASLVSPLITEVLACAAWLRRRGAMTTETYELILACWLLAVQMVNDGHCLRHVVRMKCMDGQQKGLEDTPGVLFSHAFGDIMCGVLPSTKPSFFIRIVPLIVPNERGKKGDGVRIGNPIAGLIEKLSTALRARLKPKAWYLNAAVQFRVDEKALTHDFKPTFERVTPRETRNSSLSDRPSSSTPVHEGSVNQAAKGCSSASSINIRLNVDTSDGEDSSSGPAAGASAGKKRPGVRLVTSDGEGSSSSAAAGAPTGKRRRGVLVLTAAAGEGGNGKAVATSDATASNMEIVDETASDMEIVDETAAEVEVVASDEEVEEVEDVDETDSDSSESSESSDSSESESEQ